MDFGLASPGNDMDAPILLYEDGVYAAPPGTHSVEWAKEAPADHRSAA